MHFQYTHSHHSIDFNDRRTISVWNIELFFCLRFLFGVCHILLSFFFLSFLPYWYARIALLPHNKINGSTTNTCLALYTQHSIAHRKQNSKHRNAPTSWTRLKYSLASWNWRCRCLCVKQTERRAHTHIKWTYTKHAYRCSTYRPLDCFSFSIWFFFLLSFVFCLFSFSLSFSVDDIHDMVIYIRIF